VPFPVVTDRQRAEGWWVGWATTRRMVTEYLKFLFTKLRITLDLDAGTTAS
jgi:beta-lactamase class D